MPGSPIIHYGRVKLRVTGSGVLRGTLFGYNEITSAALPNTTMQTTNARQVSRLTNFLTERAKLRLETTDINEVFRITSIVIFVRSVYSEYPG